MDKPPQDDSTQSSFFRRLLNLIKLEKAPESTEDLEQEIQELIDDGEEQGLISAQEGMMISSIFEFRDTLAKEIMTPKSDMVCAPSTASVPEIVSLIIEKGFTRIPIYTDSTDNIVGILHAKDLLNYCAVGANPPRAGEIVNPVLFVLETHKIMELLRDFKTRQIHMAIVIDEFGSVRGLVTLEDVLEEIVGEITDEYDKNHIRWREVDDKTLLTDAKVDIENIEAHFGIEFPEGPYESVGGYIIHQLGRVPEPGAFIDMPPLRMVVVAATHRKITTVKIQQLSPAE